MSNQPETKPASGRSPAAIGSGDGVTCEWWHDDTEPCREPATIEARSVWSYRVWKLCSLHAECIGDNGWRKATLPPNTSVSEGGTEASKSTGSDPRPSLD